MTTYTVRYAFGEHAAGDVVESEQFTDHDLAYLLAVDILVAHNDTPKAKKSAKKVVSENEE
jgi:hypothetical protein